MTHWMDHIKTPSLTDIGISNFVKRQTVASEFTHYDGDFDKIQNLVWANFHLAKPGYREGVCLVPVPPEGFFCGLVTLKEGDQLIGEYKARRPGEEPRKTLRVRRQTPKRVVGRRVVQAEGSNKVPCAAVDVVLYSREVLAEGDEERTGAAWDVISINGRPTMEEAPIEPMTLIANHFQLDGGTATGMTPEEFETALRESVLYWKNKAMLAPL
jgi:hypothetical protein